MSISSTRTGGNVKGPTTTVNNDVVTFDGTTGSLIKDSGLLPVQFSGARVETDETQGAGVGFADLATVGPAVTLTLLGTKALVTVTADSYKTGGAGNSSFLGVAVSGASTVAATSLCQNTSVGASLPNMLSGTILFTGLTPGSNTFTLQYKNDGGTTWHFLLRGLTVVTA